jgi:hypothetical protein
MPKMTTPDGLEHNVNEIDYDAPPEEWQEYKLADGTKIKFRAFIVSILKSDKFNELGHPYYFINSQTQMRTYAPPENCGPPSKTLKGDLPPQPGSNETIHGYR